MYCETETCARLRLEQRGSLSAVHVRLSPKIGPTDRAIQDGIVKIIILPVLKVEELCSLQLPKMFIN